MHELAIGQRWRSVDFRQRDDHGSKQRTVHDYDDLPGAFTQQLITSGARATHDVFFRSGPSRQRHRPGRYFTDPLSGCYWERQSGLGGSFGEILANEFLGFNAGQWIVDILSSDRAFEMISDCGTWSTSPRGGLQADIRPGMWLVGSQIAPGRYRTNASSGCYWERMKHFQGTINGIIDNEFVSSGGQQLVEIRASDVGFESDDYCGIWTRVS